MTSKSPKIKASQVVSAPKIALFPDDPLTKVLKPEHFIIIDPYSYNFDNSPSLSLPANAAELGYSPEEIAAVEEAILEAEAKTNLEAPNLEDITLVSVEKYTDLNNVDKLRFTFSVKNHVGASVIGVQGYGQ